MNTNLLHTTNSGYNTIINEIVNIVSPLAVIHYGLWIFSNKKSRKNPSIDTNDILNLLVILDAKDTQSNESNLISRIENSLLRIKKSSVLVHSINFVNEGLSWGQDFFIDIMERGKIIYQSDIFLITTYFKINPQSKIQRVKDVFNNFHIKGSQFLHLANITYLSKDLHVSIFLLHQATELLMRSILVTHTRYDPKTHNLSQLARYCRHITPQIDKIFFTKGKNQQQAISDFRSLQDSYVLARYELGYHINKKLVRTLLTKAKKLEQLSTLLEIRLLDKLAK
ncbi:MAG: HEPN domain-containing protein [Sphingobacterium sp.]|jgi:HEPN domain-containing protein|nr:HEPN domain-containing protein [Sphingobacterium sp.]